MEDGMGNGDSRQDNTRALERFVEEARLVFEELVNQSLRPARPRQGRRLGGRPAAHGRARVAVVGRRAMAAMTS